MLKSRKSQIILAVVVVLGLMGIAVGGFLAYTFLRAPEEASEPISSIPIDNSSDSTDVASEPAGDPADDGDSSPVSGVVLFEIVQAESEARFTINEILGGKPNTVVGSTDQVAGQISVDFGNPSASQVGSIQINARTLLTDKGNRSRAIKNQILETNTYEFITFTPTAINGWPEAPVIGETMQLEIVGNLTLLDVTREVTFALTVVAISETRLEGRGSVTIFYADYGITIPEVPSVAGVDDDLLLEIEFAAVAVD